MDALGDAVVGGCEHLDLAAVGNLHYDFAVVPWKGLLPWLPIHSHVCRVCCALVKLKFNAMCLYIVIGRRAFTYYSLQNHLFNI